MMFTLPKLLYSYADLEPYIDARTMEIHYSKHHQTYVDKLNLALKDHDELSKKTVEELLISLESIPKEIQTAVRNNGGGHYNHSFFWKVMKPKGGGESNGILSPIIDKELGGFINFHDKFTSEALNRFGSGWTWLSLDENKHLKIHSTANQDSPLLEGLKPILALDLWEHAYYLHYQNRRADYIKSWWHVVNWEQVEQNYLDATR
ncbi:superoxide dismutase [candidate division CPR3 bacterium GWF2_35_18]|nr:MAG: superoxide dismutase [candidate division CPR3 bacterium GWF2_35_18]OGB65881.1 MAG: superoxide dismutase [candidate division CPR3 bacterium RIFOXYA2_FULL_35_13]OGB77245.1 MAG: superoxide dismutase [candidate division CPR3 bacterium RIFOXYC2_FULL_35_7]OGB79208.1 MAG: superoxide dismutase [candidate division CPR3 bacterium RIFOXYB2_FULL_35_8]OGB80586.1 MAG: superoxide dismutase [candidate division CPR3 bacterium GWE2_35_7]